MVTKDIALVYAGGGVRKSNIPWVRKSSTGNFLPKNFSYLQDRSVAQKLHGAPRGELEMFNTLRYARKLEAVGLSRDQAEAQIQIIAEIIEGDLSTKQDLHGVGLALKQDIKDLRREMVGLENRIIIKLSAVMVALFTLAIAAAALLLKVH